MQSISQRTRAIENKNKVVLWRKPKLQSRNFLRSLIWKAWNSVPRIERQPTLREDKQNKLIQNAISVKNCGYESVFLSVAHQSQRLFKHNDSISDRS